MPGQQVVGTATSGTDDTGSGWNPVAQVCEDSQITNTPNPSEQLVQEYWSWEDCLYTGETWLDRRQMLIAARTTDTTPFAEVGHLALEVDGGGLDGVANLTKGWAFWLLPVLIEPEINDANTVVVEPDVDLFMYAPSGAPGGTKIRTDFFSFEDVPLVMPRFAHLRPRPGTQGPGSRTSIGLFTELPSSTSRRRPRRVSIACSQRLWQ